MNGNNMAITTIVVFLILTTTTLAYADDKGRNKKMGYCFDAAFHETTNRLYVAAGAMGTHVFDVVKGKFNYTTTVYEGGYHRNLKISGDRIYLADTKRGLVVFDITGKIPVCTWKQQEQNVSGMGIDLHDNRAYLAAGAKGLHIFDITELDSPQRIGTCKTNADAWDVWVSDNHAYVADLQKGVTVVDVSRPSQPHVASLVTWDKTEPMAEIVRGEGQKAYVAAGKQGLVVLDVNNPLAPQVISEYKSGPGGFGEGLCVRNGLVYLSNGNKENKDENGLIIIDAQVPRTLKVKGTCTFSDWVEGICLAGDYAFITNTYSGVRSIDVSDPNNPLYVDSFGPIKEEKTKDPLLASEMTPEEDQAVQEYRSIKERIITGESYQNGSTPLHAVLTHISALEQGRTRDYFASFDILRAPLPPAKPEEGSLWPVYAGDKELADTFILVYAKGQWIWIGNMGRSVDWRLTKPTFEKWARQKIEQSVPSDDSDNTPSTESQAPGESAGNCVLSLDGEEDYVRIVDSQSLHSFSNAITIEALLKASSYAEYGDINSIIRKNITAGAENFLLRFRNIGGNLWAQMSFIDIGIVGAQHDFIAGKWYHIAGTYDGSAITVLINGVTIESENFSGPLYINESDLFIGKGDPEFRSGEYFHGALDEIRIWNVARSPEEIRSAMNGPLTGKEEGLVVYLNFDDGTAMDLSGHGNDGLLNANAQIVESPFPASFTPEREKPSKLVAWWRLDEADGNDVADSSGNAYGGKLIGNPQWQPIGGKVNGALIFDGLGDLVEIGNEPAFDLTRAISIAAWIKVNSFDKRWQAIVTKGDTAWRIQRTAETDTIAFHCTGIKSIADRWPQGIEGNKSVNDGKWHYVVGVYDGSTVSLYIDGVLDNSSPASGVIQTNDFAVNIGGNSERIDREWNGLIDEVCIIAGAIDANAVNALYSGADPIMIAQMARDFAPVQTAPSHDKLVVWWKFEDDVNDSAGANHGTVNGDPTYVAGKVGRAISLDGDDYVDFGNPDLLNFGIGDWTISAWIKTTQSGTEVENRGTVFANGGDEAGGIRYALAINEAYSGTIVLTTDTDTYKVQAVGRTAVNDDAWHHVVGMRKAEQLHVYIDGVLDGGGYLSDGYDLSGTSQHNAYIGAITDNRDGSLYKYFVGLIDEVCIFRGAIDANGVRVLYSGEDPMIVAQTAIISPVVPKPKTRRQPIAGADARGGIVGDWQMISDQISTKAFIEIRRESDDSLSATIVPENVADTSQAMSMNNVTFENGKLRFEVPSNEGAFEGTMKEDGLTIAGEFRQQGQAMAIELKRVDPIPDETAPDSPEQLQAQTHSTSNIAVALILVLALAGIVGGIVFFLMKSSIRT